MDSQITFKGGYAVVYKARDLRTNESVAIKRVQTANINMKYAFTNNHPCIECEVLFQFKDDPYFPTIQQVLVDHSSGSFSIVMEYFEHSQFDDYCSELTEGQTIEYIHVLLDVIDALDQRGYVHRDIKPGNFLFNPNGKTERERYLLIDFGLVQSKRAILNEYHKEIQSRRKTMHIPKSSRPSTKTQKRTQSTKSKAPKTVRKSTRRNRKRPRRFCLFDILRFSF